MAQAIHPLAFVLSFGTSYIINSLEYTQTDNKFFLNLNLKVLTEDGNYFIANIVTGTFAPHFDWNMELATDKGKIVRLDSLWKLELLDSQKQTQLLDNPKRWKDVWHPSPVGSGHKRTGYYHELDEFFETIRNKNQFNPSLKQMLNVYELMESINQNLVKI